MFKYLRQLIGGNVLLKITSVNSLAIAVRICAGLVTSKVIAFYAGPQGMALLGDLRNFLTSTQSISTLGISNGIIKYTAELKSQSKAIIQVLSTSFYLLAIATIITALTLYLGAEYWNTLVFKGDYDFVEGFKALAFLLPLFILNAFCLAVLNGYGKFKSIIYLNVTTNIVGLIITVSLIYYYQIAGALYALIIVPAIALLITTMALLRYRSTVSLIQVRSFKWDYFKKLGSYTGMTLFSAMVSPWVYIAIRQHIINTEGLIQAGYWDAILRISDYYLMFVTTILTLYILPRLASLKTGRDFKKEILNFYKTILPIFFLGLVVIYVCRNWIIQLIFTDAFLEMEPIFFWQLLGDLIRVASIVIAYQFIAKNMFWHFIITQIISLTIIYLSSRFLIDLYGFVGASMAHTLSYACYFVVLLVIFRKPLFLNR